MTEVSLLLEETFAGDGGLWGNPVYPLPPKMQKKSSDMLGNRKTSSCNGVCTHGTNPCAYWCWVKVVTLM